MKSKNETWRFALKTLCASALALAIAGNAASQESTAGKKIQAARTPTESQAQARAILTRMASFMGGAQGFSVSLRAGYDAVQTSGQKIEFGETRQVTLSRPGRLRIEGERSDGTKTVTVFDGKEITVVDQTRNVYAKTPQPGGIDESVIHFVRDLGMRLPLAVLVVSRLPQEMSERVRSIEYIEMTRINGVPAHHLAARTDTVDFQVWVADGDQPLPQRIVLTYRNAPGQPQFWATFSGWNLKPAINDATFAAAPPSGAQQIAFAARLPRVSPVARKPAVDKGAK
jgi:hypothetical protein